MGKWCWRWIFDCCKQFKTLLFDTRSFCSITRLGYPLLLTPFLNRSWHREDPCCELSWRDARLLVFADGISFESKQDAAHLIDVVDEVTVAAGSNNEAHPVHGPRLGGVPVPRAVWRKIETFAKRTYVPASEESRARGACAGRTDND